MGDGLKLEQSAHLTFLSPFPPHFHLVVGKHTYHFPMPCLLLFFPSSSSCSQINTDSSHRRLLGLLKCFVLRALLMVGASLDLKGEKGRQWGKLGPDLFKDAMRLPYGTAPLEPACDWALLSLCRHCSSPLAQGHVPALPLTGRHSHAESCHLLPSPFQAPLPPRPPPGPLPTQLTSPVERVGISSHLPNTFRMLSLILHRQHL